MMLAEPGSPAAEPARVASTPRAIQAMTHGAVDPAKQGRGGARYGRRRPTNQTMIAPTTTSPVTSGRACL
jgi:hypothetical protein